MLQMARSIYERIIGRAREGFPFEVCGILGGKGNIVSAIYPMTNTDASRDHFMMDSREQFSVVKALRSQELEMLAVYHSHPETPARLSDEDIRLAFARHFVCDRFVGRAVRTGSPLFQDRR